MERLRVSDNGRFLVTSGGAPFFWLADTAWELIHRLSREDTAYYFENRAAKGFNVIQTVVLAERDGLHTPNVYGHTPLHDDDPTRLNEAYFAYADEVIQLAESHNLYIALLPTWGDKVDLVGGTGPVIFNADNAYMYGELVGKRYRDRANIVWVLGGDRYPEGFEAVWRAMANGIRTGAGDDALITYHPRGPGQSAAYFHDEAWLSFNIIQSGHGKYNIANYEWIAQDYARLPPKPTLDSEPNYEYHPVGFDRELRNGRFSDYDVRKAAYRAVFAGACGHTYGHHSIWQMHDERDAGVLIPGVTWREALDFPGAYQMRHLRRLMESRPFLTRIPANDLLIAPPTDPALYVSATRDANGSYAMIYIPTAGQTVNVNLERLSGERFRAAWFDPRTGHTTGIELYDQGDRRAFTSPSDGNDWVLVIDDTALNAVPPGQA